MPSYNKKRRGRLKFVALSIVAVFVFATIFMFLPSNISRQEAANIALTHIGGGVANRPHRDFERFRRVWSVEVFYNNLVHEVYVSMRTGEVVVVEVDRLD